MSYFHLGTYLKYDGAGDQYIGRLVTGLPHTEPNFALLPPFFCNDHQDEIKLLFPNLPTNLTQVAEFCLASVVFHSDYLKRTFPPCM